MIANDSDAAALRKRATELVELGTSLPDQVFANGFREYVWIYADDVLIDEFWTFLQELADTYGDEELYAVCDDRWLAEDFGHSGVAMFRRDERLSDYNAFLDAGTNPPVSIRHAGDRLVFFGSGGEWALVSDRTAEVGVGAKLGASAAWPKSPAIRFHSFDAMIALASLPYRNQMPREVRDAYIKNYLTPSVTPR